MALMPAVVVPGMPMPRHVAHDASAREVYDQASIAPPVRPAPPAMVMPPMELSSHAQHIGEAHVAPPMRPPPVLEHERLRWGDVEMVVRPDVHDAALMGTLARDVPAP